MKNTLPLAFLIIIVLPGFAQQQPVLSQYMLSPYYFNPAYTGTGELYNFSFLHRSQWSGYRDYEGNSSAPQTQLFTANANLDSTGHNVGLVMSRDKVAFLTALQAELSYAYRLSITQKSTLSLGVRAGIVTRSVDYDKYIIMHPDDEFIQDGKRSETQPNVTMGLWYNHDRYYAGVSATGLIAGSTDNTIGFKTERSIVMTAGYYIHLRPEWKLTPAIQVMTNTNRSSIQGSAVVEFNNTIWTGLAYRHQDATTLIAGFGMLDKKLRLSYAFDYTTGNKSIKSSTSHEIMIAYRTGSLAAKKKVAKTVSRTTINERDN